jgi:hypothetical protein
MSQDTDRHLALNQQCFCITLDEDRLGAALREAADPELADLLAERPHLFSRTPVFIARAELDAMLEIIAAIEAAARTPGYQSQALSWAPPIARRDFGPRGVFMGYDFHLGSAGPKLIEINTNAGGAFLNAVSAKAQRACCPEAAQSRAATLIEDFETNVWRMFQAEWRLQGRAGEPRTVAIVDDDPESQYLFPEFVLAKRFFERQGMRALILDPAALRFADGRLVADGQTIDLVYNRLVDFALASPGAEALRLAYLADAVVLTPSPRNHALLADKRNLALLSDETATRGWGLSPEQLSRLGAIPTTVPVSAENAGALWDRRKALFFKPAGGHGGKAVYRGDKLTHRVWGEIIAGGYVAQEFAPPGERQVRIDGETLTRKVDVRLYTYTGELLMAAARMYQGQTTNFRTPGGGFAPVYVV